VVRVRRELAHRRRAGEVWSDEVFDSIVRSATSRDNNAERAGWRAVLEEHKPLWRSAYERADADWSFRVSL
jgi:hypothetical protein